MLSLVYAADIRWDMIIHRTAPKLDSNRTLGALLGGAGHFTGFTIFAAAFAGMLLILYLIYGGIQLMTSAGDPKKIQSGKSIINNALIGFIIIFVAYWIVQLVGYFLGLETMIQVFNE